MKCIKIILVPLVLFGATIAHSTSCVDVIPFPCYIEHQTCGWDNPAWTNTCVTLTGPDGCCQIAYRYKECKCDGVVQLTHMYEQIVIKQLGGSCGTSPCVPFTP